MPVAFLSSTFKVFSGIAPGSWNVVGFESDSSRVFCLFALPPFRGAILLHVVRSLLLADITLLSPRAARRSVFYPNYFLWLLSVFYLVFILSVHYNFVVSHFPFFALSLRVSGFWYLVSNCVYISEAFPEGFLICPLPFCLSFACLSSLRWYVLYSAVSLLRRRHSSLPIF